EAAHTSSLLFEVFVGPPGSLMWGGAGSKTLPGPTASRVEIDQRWRLARLRLEQPEGHPGPWVRPTRSWLRQGPARLPPSIGPRAIGHPACVDAETAGSGT